jgi:cell wall-associated NlpC family hydrolase
MRFCSPLVVQRCEQIEPSPSKCVSLNKNKRHFWHNQEELMSYLKRLVTSLVLVMGFLVTTAAPSFANSYPGAQYFVTGQQNQHVAQVQSWLISMGYDISVANGRYGPQTTAAISKFYADINNASDGATLGPKGWARIRDAANAGSSPTSSTPTKKTKKTNKTNKTVKIDSGNANRDAKVEKVIAKAASMAGTPYRRGGTDPSRGLDCSGFVLNAMKPVGISFGRSSRDMRAETKKISKSELQVGDLVFYHSRKGVVYHVGIYAGGNQIWHARQPGQRAAKTPIYASNVSYGRVNY